MNNSLKVVISEGSEDFSRDMYKTLKKYPIDIFLVSNNENQILNMISNKSPELVILDLCKNTIDAIKIIRHSKNIIYNNDLTFILILDYLNKDLKKRLNDLGINNILVKPINYVQLGEKVYHILLKKQLSKLEENSIKFLYKKNIKQFDYDIELRVTEILHQLGVPAHIKGYQYIRYSIITAIKNPDIINSITKQLYPSVAKNFCSTSSRVERAIRHAIEVAWDRGDVDLLNSYFGYTIQNSKGRPTNSEFIAMISDKLRLELKFAS